MGPGGAEHQLLGTRRIKGHLHQSIVAHGPQGQHHSLAKGPVADAVPLLELEQRRALGG